MSDLTKSRMTAAERCEQILRVAVTTFAESGYTATRTDDIARRAHVSQPYVFRLFGTKQQLFLSALHHVFDRIEEIVESTAAQDNSKTPRTPATLLLTEICRALADERELLLVALHGLAAASEQAIRRDLRLRCDRLYRLVPELTRASADETRRFIAAVALLTVSSALDPDTKRTGSTDRDSGRSEDRAFDGGPAHDRAEATLGKPAQRARSTHPRQRTELLDRTVRSSRRTGDILDDLLWRVRMTAGTDEMECQPLRLDRIVTDLIDEIDSGAAKITSTTAPTVVYGDPALLRRAIRNMLDNAVGYGHLPNEPARVHVTVADGRVAVADEGPGPEDIDIDAILEDIHGGAGSTGLGVAIARRIAHAHGGTLEVHNAAGGGAIFELTLPTPARDL
ncbi:ATP-binding protein [Nocardia sp. NPDC059239]|uniref:ATP-binding protein n=1 Tax=unclassified Nocardia TaxID=2637762 RepID=UPI0036B51FCE